jgi:hypothetical protein
LAFFLKKIFLCIDLEADLAQIAEVDWHKFIWFELAIPKHAFILWLMFKNALTTKEKMCCWGFTGSSLSKF